VSRYNINKRADAGIMRSLRMMGDGDSASFDVILGVTQIKYQSTNFTGPVKIIYSAITKGLVFYFACS
jgi:hypothetical protein